MLANLISQVQARCYCHTSTEFRQQAHHDSTLRLTHTRTLPLYSQPRPYTPFPMATLASQVTLVLICYLKTVEEGFPLGLLGHTFLVFSSSPLSSVSLCLLSYSPAIHRKASQGLLEQIFWRHLQGRLWNSVMTATWPLARLHFLGHSDLLKAHNHRYSLTLISYSNPLCLSKTKTALILAQASGLITHTQGYLQLPPTYAKKDYSSTSLSEVSLSMFQLPVVPKYCVENSRNKQF